MYVQPNLKTKRALREAVAAGREVTVFQPGGFFQGPRTDGVRDVSVEGPHFPAPHTWYARVRVQDGRVVKVLG